ncbi:hypothetical protein EV189_3295 [Motilibacter rhizosphaerae]|uniref:Uncharacterized protein n=1 Tax=Motilibacter rhizosphaerae TaxID=598652 RepID=A0A4Q7NGQ1_9ACTN|nr:hypothetical protein [Motilibacter rhizosphaerae]RZS82898.1 hypothetical protein EV189_3295 [Motilibacter rhizosphaerae]
MGRWGALGALLQVGRARAAVSGLLVVAVGVLLRRLAASRHPVVRATGVGGNLPR